MLLHFAMSRNPSQNSFSSDTLVLCPAITIERFMTAVFMAFHRSLVSQFVTNGPFEPCDFIERISAFQGTTLMNTASLGDLVSLHDQITCREIPDTCKIWSWFIMSVGRLMRLPQAIAARRQKRAISTTL
jgi:hypothetical protein